MKKRILSLLLVAVIMFTTLAFELPVGVSAAPGHSPANGNYIFSNWQTSGVITTDIDVIASRPYHVSSYGYDTANSHGTFKVTTSGGDPYVCFYANGGNNGIYLGNYTHCAVTFRCDTASYLQLFLRNVAGGVGYTDWVTFDGSSYWQRIVFDIRSLHQLAGTTWSRSSNLYSFRLDFGGTSNVTYYIDSVFFTTNENDAYQYPYDRIGAQTTTVYGYNTYYSTNIDSSLVGLPNNSGGLTPGYNALTFAKDISYHITDKGYSSKYAFDHWEIHREIAHGNDLKTYATTTTSNESGTYTLTADTNLYRNQTVNLYLKAVFRTKTATITWKNHDGSTLETDYNVEYGSTPSYNGSTPQKASTAQYTYSFSGWSPSVSTVSGNQTYTAQFSSSTRSYTITFKDYDGTVLQSKAYTYGSTPSCPAPTRAADTQFTYAFAGWDKTVSSVTGADTYTATYTATPRNYTITWLNWDGTNLGTTSVAYGQTPVAPVTPSRPATDEYTYSFAGWTPTISSVTGAVTYTATYTETKNKYTVMWVDGNGQTLKTESLEYGTLPSYTGATPTKADDGENSYTFNGTWSPEITTVTGNSTYTAQFDGTPLAHTITWLDGDGELIDTTTVNHGEMPIHADPVKQNTAEYTYTFTGWSPEVVAATADATYKATFSATKNTYTIIFLDDDGTTILDTQSVEYGAIPVYGGKTPEKSSTQQYSYTFKGWSPVLGEVIGDTTYTATYEATVLCYTVTWLDENGNVLETDLDVPYGEYPSYDGSTPIKAAENGYEYIFAGWTPDPETTAVTGDMTYQAVFNKVESEYVITLIDDKNNTSVMIEYTISSTDVLPTPNAVAGFTMLGWKATELPSNAVYQSPANSWVLDDTYAAGTPITSMYGNVTLTAQWEEETITITYTPVGFGTTAPSSETINKVTGVPQGSTALPGENYKFIGWYSEIDCINKISDQKQYIPSNTGADVIYYALFELAIADLKITVTGTKAIDENQSYIFDITDPDGEKMLTVAVKGDSTVTVKNVPVGSYTVSEKDDWSWRYSTDEGTQSQIITLVAEPNTTDDDKTNDNTAYYDQKRAVITTQGWWLGGDGYKKNKYPKKANENE